MSDHTRRRFLSQSAALGAVACLGAPAVAAASSVTASRFEPLIGAAVTLRGSGGRQRARLAEVTRDPADPGRPAHVRQDPFSLFFHAPRGADFEDQQCQLCHPELGVIQVFVNRVDNAKGHVTLQTVFA